MADSNTAGGTDENDRRHPQLLRQLRKEGRLVVPAAGRGLDDAWPPEASVTVPDIDTEASVDIGYGQLSMLRIRPDLIEVLDCSSGETQPPRHYDIAANLRTAGRGHGN
ncbi:DUF3293 domain-containing protein [Rhabdothermincola salaria]|uniref:DUF3293 domain-containing protein n=1 Tax=Rhabdothermincola salaria TaxID=2903142 RepID=UPI001E48AD59|nr:DUF3293 domain-containing protein [Rhabdothermincola salaria]